MGRPTKYNAKRVEQVKKYFRRKLYRKDTFVVKGKDGIDRVYTKLIANDLPLLQDFAKHIGVNRDTLHAWGEKYPEFSDALKIVKEMQERFLVTHGLNGQYAAPFAIFTAKNILGWRDKTEVDQNVFNRTPTKIIIGKPVAAKPKDVVPNPPKTEDAGA